MWVRGGERPWTTRGRAEQPMTVSAAKVRSHRSPSFREPSLCLGRICYRNGAQDGAPLPTLRQFSRGRVGLSERSSRVCLAGVRLSPANDADRTSGELLIGSSAFFFRLRRHRALVGWRRRAVPGAARRWSTVGQASSGLQRLGVKRTGRAFKEFANVDFTRPTGPAIWMSGSRLMISVSPTESVLIARKEPWQKCGPPPPNA